MLHAVSPAKDVDAFHPENVGRIVQGRPRFLPCTPHGVQQLLVRNDIEIAGRHVVVVGRSDIVGKPLAIMLMQRGPGGDATVTVCHSRTRDLAAVTPHGRHPRRGHRPSRSSSPPTWSSPARWSSTSASIAPTSGLVGDVDFAAVQEVAGAITPVPGGVGPLTVAMLLRNTLTAAQALET